MDHIVAKKKQIRSKPTKKRKPAPKGVAANPSDELRLEELDRVSGGTRDLSLVGSDGSDALAPYVPLLAVAKNVDS
jgi:hypothetical protein